MAKAAKKKPATRRKGQKKKSAPPGGPEFDPFDDSVLSAYLKNVRDWHGFIRFLGLPYLKENPDIVIDRLYVEPKLSETNISSDTDPENWPKPADALSVIADTPRCVLLGDPGCGKSTLINWIAWQLARPGDNPAASRLGRLLPVPLVLRELRIGRNIDLESLIDAFLDHDMAKPLAGAKSRLLDLMEDGRVCFLIDGLDEVGDIATRRALRSAFQQGFSRYPSCRWILTSRIVGYDDAPIEFLSNEDLKAAITNFSEIWSEEDAKELSSHWLLTSDHVLADPFKTDVPEAERDNLLRAFRNSAVHRKENRQGKLDIETMSDSSSGEDSRIRENLDDGIAKPFNVKRLYVSPFDDRQIRRFVENWYRIRESADAQVGAGSRNLVLAIEEDHAIQRLARIPNLLTMMALIHRIRARLPNGRALLYAEICQAYLESIDGYRGVRELNYPLAEQKRWLARVGYEMQRRRVEGSDNAGADQDDTEILATSAEVIEWISQAMAESGRDGDDDEAEEFVDYIARRSGLLLPRGESRFAFMHLSFQEYFAAVYLNEIICTPSWLMSLDDENAPFSGGKLYDLAGTAVWREVLVFLFEVLAETKEWGEKAAEVFFDRDFEGIDLEEPNRAQLLARLAVDPHTRFSDEMRRSAMRACLTEIGISRSFERHRRQSAHSACLNVLLSAEPEILEIVWAVISGFLESGAGRLNFSGCGRLHDLAPLAGLTGLQTLDLDGTGVHDLAPLAGLTGLQTLDLNGTGVQDLAPLAGLTGLQWLDLNRTGVDDLAPLAGLTGLQWLDLNGTGVHDLAPLAGLTGLQRLDLNRTGVDDLAPLAGLTGLRLDLNRNEA